MQCIARAVEHLPVTHLEIVTLAYAAMNFVIYVFWWNKPVNVNRPVRVFRKSEPMETQPQVRETVSEAQKLTWEKICKGLSLGNNILGIQDDDVDLSREGRVPRFWADDRSGGFFVADFIILLVSVCFEAIHSVAWVFPFPTHGVVDLENLERRYHCCPPLYPFGIPFGFVLGKDDGLWEISHNCYFFWRFIWRHTVYSSLDGHFGFSIYIC